MASNVIIEEPLDAEDILCAAMATMHVEVNGASIFYSCIGYADYKERSN